MRVLGRPSKALARQERGRLVLTGNKSPHENQPPTQPRISSLSYTLSLTHIHTHTLSLSLSIYLSLSISFSSFEIFLFVGSHDDVKILTLDYLPPGLTHPPPLCEKGTNGRVSPTFFLGKKTQKWTRKRTLNQG